VRGQIHPGDAIPVYERQVDAENLVRFAGASGDFARQHWDHRYMVERGFPGVIIHGWFTFAIMCETLHRWLPPETAEIVSFKVRYHRTHLPGLVRCGGEVVSVRSSSPLELELSMWAAEGEGAKTTTASLVARSLSRSAGE
jgi:acyl dehydratase